MKARIGSFLVVFVVLMAFLPAVAGADADVSGKASVKISIADESESASLKEILEDVEVKVDSKKRTLTIKLALEDQKAKKAQMGWGYGKFVGKDELKYFSERNNWAKTKKTVDIDGDKWMTGTRKYPKLAVFEYEGQQMLLVRVYAKLNGGKDKWYFPHVAPRADKKKNGEDGNLAEELLIDTETEEVFYVPEDWPQWKHF